MSETMTIVATPEANGVDAGSAVSDDVGEALLRLFPVRASDCLFGLSGEETLIGTGPHCDVRLHDDGVSHEHAVIQRAAGQLQIRDCGSTQGTFVNDQPVRSHNLQAGDRIRVGNHLFKYLSADHFESQYCEAVYEMMTVDGLTGSHNRRYFDDAFARELLRALRHWRPIALLLFDIDHFHRVNDELGHLAGDEILRSFSDRVCSRIRGEDLFARIGGEQFALAMTEAPLKQAVRVAQDFRRLIETEPFLTSRGPVQLTISVGVGFANGQGPVTVGEIVQQARDNLSRAKAQGRNSVCY